MSIADELRKLAWDYANKELYVAVEADTLFDIANHIDEAHEREVREQYDKGLNDGYDVGFASADDWDDDHADALHKHGWVRLPVDADGEYIRVGDKLDGYKETIVVDEMALQYGSWALVSDDRRAFHCPEAFTHHKPTVEDVLDKFALEIDDARHIPDADDEYARIRAEYAAKLREAVRDA